MVAAFALFFASHLIFLLTIILYICIMDLINTLLDQINNSEMSPTSVTINGREYSKDNVKDVEYLRKLYRIEL